ncbi:hypothetical protein QTP88_008667 [Uroleucon formosanum]
MSLYAARRKFSYNRPPRVDNRKDNYIVNERHLIIRTAIVAAGRRRDDSRDRARRSYHSVAPRSSIDRVFTLSQIRRRRVEYRCRRAYPSFLSVADGAAAYSERRIVVSLVSPSSIIYSFNNSDHTMLSAFAVSTLHEHVSILSSNFHTEYYVLVTGFRIR